MKLCLCLYALVVCVSLVCGKKNVLLIISDDLRPELGVYQEAGASPAMKTPRLDALAGESLVFRRAYCQQAVCNPSRTSFLTSRRPDTTKVYTGSTYWRNLGTNFTTLPQYFKDNAYVSVGMGKIYHVSAEAGINNDPPSWSEDFYTSPSLRNYWGSKGHMKEYSWRSLTKEFLDNESSHPDGELADHAIETLQKLSPQARTGEKPFFMAVGFKMPHLPFMAPKEYFDLYPEANVGLPDNAYAPNNMPTYALARPAELMDYGDIGDITTYTGEVNTTLPDTKTKELRRAYFAAVSYVDHLVGRILDELSAQDLTTETVVAFVSDHGFKLGEHAAWTKNDNFELSTHVPMMIRVPGKTDGGMETSHLVELVDLFPTLVDLAELPQVSQCPKDSSAEILCTEGSSLVPLFSDTEASGWKQAAFSQYPRTSSGNYVMGYSMRTDRYRYTEWVKIIRRTNTPNFRQVEYELYDHVSDPDENNNIANSTDSAITSKLSSTLRAGWFDSLPGTTSGSKRVVQENVDEELDKLLEKLSKWLRKQRRIN